MIRYHTASQGRNIKKLRHPRSLKLHLKVWRARFSIPVLLSQCDEHKIIACTSAISGGFAILTISLAAWWSGLPMLFPSLGPSAFLQFTRPFDQASAPRSIIFGHAIAIAYGWLAWALVSFFIGEPVSIRNPGIALCISANLGLMMMCLGLIHHKCPHAPACATALIVATGAVTGWVDVLVMLGAVIILAYQAVVIHRIAGVPAPLWSFDEHRVNQGVKHSLAA